MSGQTQANNQDYYYLSSRGVDSISFVKQAAPPLAYLDKGILYELSDGSLNYNGAALQTEGNISADYLSTTAGTGVLGVDVKSSAAPAAGDVLIATSANAATWQPLNTQNGFLDTQFSIVDAVDQTKVLKFDVNGSTGVTTTVQAASTASRNIVLPDDSGALVYNTNVVSNVGQIPTYSATSHVEPSGLIETDGTGFVTLANTAVGATVTTSGLFVVDSLSGPTSISNAFIAGRNTCNNATAISNSVFVGNDHISAGAPASITNSIAIGSGYASVGGLTGTGAGNVVVGIGSAIAVTSASNNIVCGNGAGVGLTTGSNNVFMGTGAGAGNVVAGGNVCLGYQAGSQITGGTNICIGYQAGNAATTGAGDIYIGHAGVAAEASTIRVGTAQTKNFQAGIFGVTTDTVDAIPVLVSSQGQLGTVSSSIKYKENVRSLAEDNTISLLRPVSFNYKCQPHHESIGLIAEEVAQIDDSLCVYRPITRKRYIKKYIESEEEAEASSDEEMDLSKSVIFESKTSAQNQFPPVVLYDDEDLEGVDLTEFDEEEFEDKELLTVDYNKISILLIKEVQELRKAVIDLQKNSIRRGSGMQKK